MVQLASLWLLLLPWKVASSFSLSGTALAICHPLNCVLFGRRVAGTSQNHVREDVDNHGTVIESCFVYRYSCSHSAWRYLPWEQLTILFEEQKGRDGAGLCLLCQFMHVYLPTRCTEAFGIMAGLFRLSHWNRGRKSVATIPFPSPRTCSEIGGSSDKESVVLGLLGCQTLEICMVHRRGQISLQSVYGPGYYQPVLFQNKREIRWALAAFSVTELSLKEEFH